jgi:hypothetical protein
MSPSAEGIDPRFVRSQIRSINLTVPRLPGIILGLSEKNARSFKELRLVWNDAPPAVNLNS